MQYTEMPQKQTFLGINPLSWQEARRLIWIDLDRLRGQQMKD